MDCDRSVVAVYWEPVLRTTIVMSGTRAGTVMYRWGCLCYLSLQMASDC